mmetsp:Transcript_21526/g.31272  ORF Transcript_21526/g.31272 Transcript_21526/m.31272 type:complete len:125 (+) Transcript_21526:93-467(+)|eukprot:CAMPEP_0185024240 /NCGR_PEP_ID=MMETSP1103-20130426/7234_1 /TAXON_ID=36769 /ORGANISM="Paraphysomonas bandaiensis, Strain Caron Lab Isolate" /LENGTH=124 /DNA_ID=CAMNT_0027557159 /DNA_START=71 /DNA_END=445 /DNA_ORIENTATION=+
MITRGLLRRGLLKSGSRALKGGDGPRMLPFARLAPPTEKLPEHADLIWDDGVAPEAAVDIEVPHIPLGTIILHQLTAAALLLGLYGLCVLIDPANLQPVAPRKLALPTREEMEFDDDHGRAVIR